MNSLGPSIQNLSSVPSKRAEVFALIEAHFPTGAAQASSQSFEDEFASLLNTDNRERVLFVEEAGRAVASLSWRPFELHTGLKGACAGLVVTASSHRKKGYSKALLKEAERQAKAQGASIICLWSDLLDFYQKLGYILCASELSWDLSNAEVPDSQNYNIQECKEADLSELLKIYLAQNFGPRRSLEDFQRQFSQSHSLSLLAKDSTGKIAAYAFAGKGRDLRNVVHEISGDFESFSTLLSEFQKKLETDDQHSLRLQFPFSHPQTLALESTLGSAEQGAVCFAKVLDLPTLANAINKELQLQGLKDCKITLPSNNGGLQAWKLEHKGTQIFISPDAAHLLQIFSSPWPLEDIEGLGNDVKQALKSWSPYPLYFWGMDSV